MNQFLSFLLFSFLFTNIAAAQPVADTAIIPRSDSSLQKADTLIKDSLPATHITPAITKKPVQDTGWRINFFIPLSSPAFSWQLLQHHPWFGFHTRPTNTARQEFRQSAGKELLFYLLVFLLIIFGFLRNAFPKYFSDLFQLFFRTTLKQRQIREQLMQTLLPSLLMNGFFVISAGLYITFLLRYFNLNPVDNFWLLFLYCCVGLSVAYLVKFLGLKISGWVFNMAEVANSYIFIVFIVNKMIGILLLPFLVLLAFTTGNIYAVSITLSWCLVAGLLVYRFILVFAAIRNQVKVNPFHFFLYLCAFEIAPLLLVYKGLLQFFNQTA